MLSDTERGVLIRHVTGCTYRQAVDLVDALDAHPITLEQAQRAYPTGDESPSPDADELAATAYVVHHLVDYVAGALRQAPRGRYYAPELYRMAGGLTNAARSLGEMATELERNVRRWRDLDADEDGALRQDSARGVREVDSHATAQATLDRAVYELTATAERLATATESAGRAWSHIGHLYHHETAPTGDEHEGPTQ